MENASDSSPEVNNNVEVTKGDEGGSQAGDEQEEDLKESLVGPAALDGRRVSNVEAQYCNGFNPTSRACIVL